MLWFRKWLFRLRQPEELVAGILLVEAALGVGHGLFDGVENLGDIRFGILVDGGARAVAEQTQRGDGRFHGCVSCEAGVSQTEKYLSSISLPFLIHEVKSF